MALPLNVCLWGRSELLHQTHMSVVIYCYVLKQTIWLQLRKHVLIGSRGGIWTHNLKIVRRPLCHLSYRASVSLIFFKFQGSNESRSSPSRDRQIWPELSSLRCGNQLSLVFGHSGSYPIYVTSFSVFHTEATVSIGLKNEHRMVTSIL